MPSLFAPLFGPQKQYFESVTMCCSCCVCFVNVFLKYTTSHPLFKLLHRKQKKAAREKHSKGDERLIPKVAKSDYRCLYSPGTNFFNLFDTNVR